VRDGLRVDVRRRVGCDVLLQPATDEAEVRIEVGSPICLARQRRYDVDKLGHQALQGTEEHSIGAELEDRAAAGVARELGVGRLVRVPTEAAGGGDAEQDVGAAVEAVVLQWGLNDRIGAGAHRGERGSRIVAVPKVDDR
jgi:hypothetical protein